MSTKLDAKIISDSTGDENDWEEDDQWDDWGDAEDKFENVPETKPPESHRKQDSSVRVYSNNEEIEQQNMLPTQTAGWGGLFSGVVSSVLTTASDLSTTVSQGLNQVIGVPDPEELVRMQAAESAMTGKNVKRTTDVNKQEKEGPIMHQQIQSVQQEPDGTPVFGLNIVSGVTSIGTKVLNTGLDTLEGIGKKTMHILQENDPLLMNKRKLLGLDADRPNLSEVLKEAKKDADNLENTLKELKLEKSREMLRFDLLFENHCGLVHLEALEILSHESSLKLQKLKDAVSGKALTELQETIDEVKELMELEDLEGESDGNYDVKELNARLMGAIEDVDLHINFDDIANHWTIALQWLNETQAATLTDTNEIVQESFARGITTLAEACALQINKLHKIAELFLVKDHHSTANEVDCIVQLCKQFIAHLNGLTNRFATALTSIKMDAQNATEDDLVKARVSMLFAEMLNATQYIEKAFKLFLPILQIGAV
ncbi:protein FAM114A2 isoform X2 [Eurosta solidaginis]|uniref:protein FAM114A2 isoform X2 n=1 Tax=Eurosta solidaginis TaxID=178769 RepID=UPI0035305BB1